MEIYVSYYAVACVILRRIHWIATWVERDLRKYNDNACYAGWTVCQHLLLNRWASQNEEIQEPYERQNPAIIMRLPCRCRSACSGEICFGYLTRSLVLPALLHCLPDTLRVLLPIILIQVRCLDIGRGASVRVIQKAALCQYPVVITVTILIHPYLWMLVKTAATSYVGLHLFCRMSRQSSPVA